tara:strand:- start:138610 stop:138726 length:117 start_codon:yes stop_codon:yes gene_type:complete
MEVSNIKEPSQFWDGFPFYFENSDDWMASDENYLASAR